MRKTTLNNFIKCGVIVSAFAVLSCSVERDIRHETQTSKIKVNALDLSLNYHVKNGDYIISIHDSIGNKLTERFINLQDSSAFKTDTVDLNGTHPYWTRQLVERILRECIENNTARIYSIEQTQYIDRIKRTVSKSKFKSIHTYYTYTNLGQGDTILYSYSFDTGCPPF